jgi:hypothetical protein
MAVASMNGEFNDATLSGGFTKKKPKADGLKAPPIPSDFVAFLPLLCQSELCPCRFRTKRHLENPRKTVSSRQFVLRNSSEGGCAILAFSRPFPLIAGNNTSNLALTPAPTAHFSSSISIFTPAILPAQVGQMLSNLNYFCGAAL